RQKFCLDENLRVNQQTLNKDSSLSIIILGLGFSVVIFVLCSLIDLLKQTLFKKVLQVQKLVRKDGK
ncbi:MAG: hypothetical protein L0J44_12610, partial [Tetragenococcus koreensis]|nr:hypothetical protein [Tetragenococcus koreensis]